jgi:hypothetical protein
VRGDRSTWRRNFKERIQQTPATPPAEQEYVLADRVDETLAADGTDERDGFTAEFDQLVVATLLVWKRDTTVVHLPHFALQCSEPIVFFCGCAVVIVVGGQAVATLQEVRVQIERLSVLHTKNRTPVTRV